MSVIYEGPLRHRIDAYNHEGYAEDTDLGSVARCTCGWRGSSTHRADSEHDDAWDQAHEEWSTGHLQLMLDAEAERHTIPAADVLALAQGLRVTAVQQHSNGGRELDASGMALCQAAERLDELVEQIAERNPASLAEQWAKEAGW